VIVAILRDTAYEEKYVDSWTGCLERRGIRVRWADLTTNDALDQGRRSGRVDVALGSARKVRRS
jgi:hypothetical protein